MGTIGICLLRVSMGALMAFWGLDKLVNVEHGIRVAQAFYFGVEASAAILGAFGVAQTLLGLLIVLGWQRRYTYPLLSLITLTTAVGVWRSILDPWGWWLEGSNVLFYPSAIIFSASLVLWGMQQHDTLNLDSRRSR